MIWANTPSVQIQKNITYIEHAQPILREIFYVPKSNRSNNWAMYKREQHRNGVSPYNNDYCFSHSKILQIKFKSQLLPFPAAQENFPSPRVILYIRIRSVNITVGFFPTSRESLEHRPLRMFNETHSYAMSVREASRFFRRFVCQKGALF